MKSSKKIFLFFMISIITIGLTGCGSANIKLNKSVKVKEDGVDYSVVFKPVEVQKIDKVEDLTLYVVPIEITNNFKDKGIALGRADIVAILGQDIFSGEGLMLRNKEGKIILGDKQADYFHLDQEWGILNTPEVSSSIVKVAGKETKTFYYPIAEVENVNLDINNLEIIYMDEEKGEYKVIK